MIKAKLKRDNLDNSLWVVCGDCDKKLERVREEFQIIGVERKCPRCSEVNEINLSRKDEVSK
jgi:phage FluMu protein Com